MATGELIGISAGFTFPVMTGGIVGPNLSGYEDVAANGYSNLGWAVPFRIPESMNIDAIAVVIGSTAWSGRKLGLYTFDGTAAQLGTAVAENTGLGPSADTILISTFTPVAVIKDDVLWIAAGGGTGMTKMLAGSQANETGSNTALGLVNTVGALTLDETLSPNTNSSLSSSLQVSANTPAASGTLIAAAASANGIAVPICGVRKSS